MVAVRVYVNSIIFYSTVLPYMEKFVYKRVNDDADFLELLPRPNRLNETTVKHYDATFTSIASGSSLHRRAVPKR